MSHFENLIVHRSVADHLTKGSPPIPVHVRIETTECCNLRCCFCVWHNLAVHERIASVTSYSGTASLPCNRLLKLIEELKCLGTKAISFTGSGDPLVYPHIEEVLQKIVQSGIQFAITSNFSMPLTDPLLSLLCKASWIRVSMNAAEPETYGEIHSPVEKDRELVFNRLMDNIRRLVRARRVLCSEVQINASFVVSEHNGNEVSKAGELARELGFDSISFRPDDPNICGSKPLTFSAAVQKQLTALQNLQNDGFKVLATDSHSGRKQDKIVGVPCRYANYTAYIAANGEVYPCCYTRYDKRFIIGNILSMDFRDFWWSRQHQNNLEQVLIENCPECPYDGTNIRLQNFFAETSYIASEYDPFI